MPRQWLPTTPGCTGAGLVSTGSGSGRSPALGAPSCVSRPRWAASWSPRRSWAGKLSRGLLRAGADGRLPAIRHTCDESACCNPSHWVLGSKEDNAADYLARKDDPFGPLADRRGPAGRARAIRDAILRARSHGGQSEAVEEAIRQAMAAGMPGLQGRLF
jgi:hypothetical protein